MKKKTPTVTEQAIRLLIGAQLNLSLAPNNAEVVTSARDLIAEAIRLLNPPRVNLPQEKEETQLQRLRQKVIKLRDYNRSQLNA